MKRIRTHLPKGNPRNISKYNLVKGALLSPLYLIGAYFYRTPGLYLHYLSALLGMRLLVNGRSNRDIVYNLIVSPMDSFRYFEFDFTWKSFIKKTSIEYHLDISSPRLFTILLLDRFSNHAIRIVNPDKTDLDLTKVVVDACGYHERCSFHDCTVSDLELPPSSVDTVTMISVLEHIPGPDDVSAINSIWTWLRNGGRLLISVPCARNCFEEYIDLNEYVLLKPDEEGFVFGQRFYDDDLLNERIFSITGKPIRYSIYGEKKQGVFLADRDAKLSNPDYPFWKQPYMMGKNYAYFESINELPGWGVIAMEFVKT